MSKENSNEKIVTTQQTSKKLKIEKIFIFLSLVFSGLFWSYGEARGNQTYIEIGIVWVCLTFVWFFINKFRIWMTNG